MGDCVKFSVRILIAAALFLAAAVTFVFAFAAYKGKYFFRSEPQLRQTEVNMEKRALADRHTLTTELCREKLIDDGQKEAYAALKESVFKGESERMWLDSADRDDFQIALNAFSADHPEVFWLDLESGYKFIEYDDSLCVELLFTDEGDALAAKKKELEERVQQAVSSAPDNVSDYEMELYLNDYMTDACAYDIDGEMKHTAYGALVGGKAVCDGYSHAFQLLCRRLGIECTIVEGTSDFNSDADNGHMWNCILLDGDWYHVDVTWNDSTKAMSRAEHYFYLNLTDAEIAGDHIISGDYDHRGETGNEFFNIFVPECSSERLNYAKLNFVTVKDPEKDDDILAALISASRQKSSYCAYLVDEDENFSALTGAVIDKYAAEWIEGSNRYTGSSRRISADSKVISYENKRIFAIVLNYE